MDDFEMELRSVEFALVVGDHRDRRVRRSAGGDEPVRKLGDAVAVTHPYRIAPANVPDAVGQCRVRDQLDFGAAEFAMMAALHLAAELLRHGLLAVADAEHG